MQSPIGFRVARSSKRFAWFGVRSERVALGYRPMERCPSEAGQGGSEMERKTRHGSGTKRGSSPSHTDVSYPSVKTSWSITAVRGKVTKRCLWVACKAVTTGIFLIIIGSGMATVGYYSDQLSTVEERRGNTTVLVKNQNTDSHLSSLTYIGPAVMGVGGFIILASCVMTCEARDTAAKIVPVWFRKMRVHAVAGAEAVPGAPITRRTRWERFLAQSAVVESGSGSASHESSRSAIATALVNFSKYLQNSFDLAKIADKASENKDKLHKCPSEPTFPRDVEREALLSTNDNFLKPPFPEIIVPAESATSSSKPVPLNLAVQMYRQAKSVDCPRRDDAPFHTSPKPESSPVELVPPVSCFHQRALYDVNQQVSRSDSNGSMAMDIHLPDGSVTVRVKDESRSAAYEPSLSSRQNSSRQSSYSSTTGPDVPVKRERRSSRNRLTPSRDEGSAELSSPLLRVPTIETAPPPPPAILCRPRSRERRDSSTQRRHPLLRQTAIDTAEHEISDAV